MKHVSILVLNYVNLAAMEQARTGLEEANEYLQSQGQEEYFDVELVGLESVVRLHQGRYSIHVDKVLSQVRNTDLVIIPPVQLNFPEAIISNSDFSPWILSQYKAGAEIASLCVGAFILGSTGILNGKNCVTHWRAASEFCKLFPDVKLLPEQILTDEDGIYTGGGAFTSVNLLLYIIEKKINREAAIYCAKILQADYGRASQTPFIIFEGQKDHFDAPIREIQEYIEKNYSDKLNVDDICTLFGIGRRTFERRFKKATNNTILEYIQRVRIEAAKRGLETGTKTVSEVMFEVGYTDLKAFREIFRRYSGMTPSAYIEKYSKAIAYTNIN